MTNASAEKVLSGQAIRSILTLLTQPGGRITLTQNFYVLDTGRGAEREYQGMIALRQMDELFTHNLIAKRDLRKRVWTITDAGREAIEWPIGFQRHK